MTDCTLSEYIITRLMDTISTTTSDSVPVLVDRFTMERDRLLSDINEVYTKQELTKLSTYMDTYQFEEIIRCIAEYRSEQYELERMD